MLVLGSAGPGGDLIRHVDAHWTPLPGSQVVPVSADVPGAHAQLDVFANVVEEAVHGRAGQSTGPLTVRCREANVDVVWIERNVSNQHLAHGLIEVGEHDNPSLPIAPALRLLPTPVEP